MGTTLMAPTCTIFNYLWRYSCDLAYQAFSHFSAYIIEKLGGAWGQSYYPICCTAYPLFLWRAIVSAITSQSLSMCFHFVPTYLGMATLLQWSMVSSLCSYLLLLADCFGIVCTYTHLLLLNRRSINFYKVNLTRKIRAGLPWVLYPHDSLHKWCFDDRSQIVEVIAVYCEASTQCYQSRRWSACEGLLSEVVLPEVKLCSLLSLLSSACT